MGRASVLEEFILNPAMELKEVKISCREGSDIWGWVRVNKISLAKSDNLYSCCRSITPRTSE